MDTLDHKLDQLIDACNMASDITHEITELLDAYVERMKQKV